MSACFTVNDNQVEAAANVIMDRVEDIGGAVAAIESGYMQAQIQEATVTHQREVEAGERIVVGVNEYVDENEQLPPAIFRPESAGTMQPAQLKRLDGVKARRDSDAVDASLVRLREDARGEANLMPALLEAVRVYATLGEMCGVLRDEWGEYTPPTAV